MLSWPLALNKFRRGAHIKSNLLAGTEKAQQLDPGCSTPQYSSVLPSTCQSSTAQFPSVEMEQQLACECTRGSNWSGDRIVAVQQRTPRCREDIKVRAVASGGSLSLPFISGLTWPGWPRSQLARSKWPKIVSLSPSPLFLFGLD